MIIMSDTHLGTHRQAGTTPASQSALKQYLRDSFKGHVGIARGQVFVLNGDMFDGFSVDPTEVVFAYTTLSQHVETGGTVILCMGNHDASAKGEKMSSFHLLAHVLTARYPNEVKVIDHTDGLTCIDRNWKVWAIPHMLNQALFDLEIERAITTDGPGYLLLHCNVMSPFAEHSDHSLNLNEDQIDRLVNAGWHLIVGHEHQMKTFKAGRVIVPGNQIPSSIADCIGNKNMEKHYVQITSDGAELVPVLDLDPIFIDINWRDLDQDLFGYKFIRVSGECSSDEAADMVSAIAKLRQRSDAFVVSNAVRVDGVAQMEGLAEMSLSEISKFDVLGALLEELDEREQQVVKELLK